ncbi:MAG: ShlB/FhaC/HecB family hemolysin secretion/activation protein [Scytonema hyalinum WJT4-NPBG1]|nr:ShlB/FhaC/HecB family hemolysin secretion/activation protein [Scytonema hyalinum WJT4-NPBG1]
MPSGIFWLWASSVLAVIYNTSNVVAQTLPDPTVSPQSDPNRDRFLQPAPVPSPVPENTQPQPELTPSTPEKVEPSQPEQRFFVKEIKVTPSTVLSQAEIDKITQPFKDRDNVTLQELVDVADKITQFYLNRGYITSRAVLVDQTLTTGVVQIRIIEGGVEEIKVEGTQRVNPEYITSRIRLAGLNPVRKDKLEDQLILLRADPLFRNVEGSLRPGNKFGQSIVVVRVSEANPFRAAFNVDNYSPPSVGSERFGVGLAYRNITGFGDQIAFSYNRSTTGGANLYDFNYRVPLNAMNGTLQLRAAINDYKITDPQFSAFGIRGNSNLYELSYSQPLIRSPREEFALSLGFTFQDGQTFVFNNLPFAFGIGPDKNGVSRTSVFKFGLDYVKRDPKGAWTLRSQFNLGTGLFDATINSDPIPDSRFFSWLAQVQRVQRLSNDQLLIAAIDLQLTPNSLLPSQQFIIGGGQSVRGYRQNARYGDNGVRFSVEDRITLQRNEAGAATLQIAPFIDLGAVWNKSDNPNDRSLPGQRFLASGGLGLLWEPIPRLNVRLDYGIPFVDLSDRGNNVQDSGFYFSINYLP